jgi:hypothetical protein
MGIKFCWHHVIFSFSLKSNTFAYFSTVYCYTKRQESALNDASVARTSEVRTTTMSVLVMTEDLDTQS